MSLDVDKKKRLNLDMKVKNSKFGKMRRICLVMKVNGLAPKNIDNTGKEEDVEDDDEKGGQGEDEDTAAIVHPTVDGVVVVPEVRSRVGARLSPRVYSAIAGAWQMVALRISHMWT